MGFEDHPSGIVLAIIAVTPIVIIPFSIAMEDEKPTRHSLMGSLLAIVGACGLTLVH
jgi:drug/metabolite transporter (DMT)-like permease